MRCMKVLQDKKIVLGITGGIAAYKSAILARRLIDVGATVRVVMTAGAQSFIQPMTFQALTGNPRIAHGVADDLLSTLCLATEAPLVVAPAMNRLMWTNPATEHNCNILRSRGIRFIGPAEGSQACGESGAGRLPEPEQIRDQLISLLGSSSMPAGQQHTNDSPLRGKHILITAGPTREAIDPVRYISNHSSGKMGFALADAAVSLGAKVTLIAGPVALQANQAIERIDVESAQQMHAAVMQAVTNSDVFISVAAVADYRMD